MANEGADWTLQGLDNPLVIQHMLLNRFEQQTGGVIVDTNNPACVLMENFAQMTSSQIRMMDDNVRPAIYPARAVTTSDLLKHISDYDYVDIFSTPCPATITFIVEKSYVITHSIPVEGKDYSKMVIPRSTQITLGEHTFGLYYPIEFRTNLRSGRFSVLYQDRDEAGNPAINPLKTLETNVLDFEFREYNGHKLAFVKIPCYQFAIQGYDTTLTTTAGFKERIPYQNKFYALRCWADVLTNFGHDDTEEDVFERKELALAVSGQTYDPTVPTVVFTPDIETNELIVEIPYVYFTENRIRGVLHVDIYTTEGYLDYQVPYNTDTSCVIDMFTHISADEEEMFNATTYAEPFRQMPALNAYSITSHIFGGTNGIDFEALRQKVIKGANTNVLQTPDDINVYFASQGYTATLYRDGITDRIFIVHATVRDTDGVVIGADSIGTLIDFSKINDYGTIIKAPDSASTYTILPSTIYQFDTNKHICVPLTDVERMKLDAMSPAEKVAEYNSKIFTLSPFHIQVNAAHKYPTTITYDMLQVKRVARTHIDARDSQFGLALNSVNLDVYPSGLTNKYRMTIRVARVGFGNEIPVRETFADTQGEKKIRVLVGMKNDDGEYRWTEMAYIGREAGDEDNADNEVFELLISPNYVFHQANNQHTVQMAFWDSDQYSDYFLRSEVRVILLMRDGLRLTNDEGETYKIEGDQALLNGTKFSSGTLVLPTSKTVPINTDVGMNNFYAMLEHKCVFQFGSPVDELDQRINLTYSEAVYQTHLTTKFRTLDNDVYATDTNGNVKIVNTYIKCGVDEIAKAGVFYYDDDQGTNQMTVTVGVTNVSAYYKKVVSLEKLLEKGTLAALSSTGAELVKPNKYNFSNYIGCVDAEDPTKVYNKTLIDEEIIKKDKSMSVTNAPLVPKFAITSGSACEGKYELINAFIKHSPLSDMSDVWARVGHEVVDSSKVRNTLIKTQNALRVILSEIAVSVDAESDDDDPIGSLTNKYKVGTFLIVNNDYSSPKTIQVGTIGDEPSSGVYTRLYYKYRDLTTAEKNVNVSESATWLCICQGDNLEALTNAITEAERESSEDEVRNPKYYGLAYVLATYIGDRLNNDDVLEKVNYMAFLTQYKLTDNVESFVETDDTTSIYTKEYYLLNEDGTYVLAVESDFDDDGDFFPDTVYYERTAETLTFTVPNFNMIEKSAWERRTFYVALGATDAVEEGVDYYYWVKAAGEQGIERYELYDPSLDLSTVSFDRKLYKRKELAECTDTEYGWEQHGNRWPWEMDNWLYAQVTKLTTDDDSPTYTRLIPDDKLIIDDMYDRIRRYCEFSSGQVILDEDGHPLEDYAKPRYLQYLVDMLQMDAKLAQVTVLKEDTRVGSNFGDDGPTAQTYPTSVVTVLRNHFDIIGKSRNTMFTNTRLFFEPIKSLGFADFNVGNGVIRELPLDVSMKFRLHVSKDVYEDDILLIQLKKQIVEIIDNHIDTNGYVNCAEIANAIKADMNGSIKHVDVLGVDGDPDLQTMKSENKEVHAHLAHRLKILDDGITIDVERALDLEVVINE